MEKGPYRGAHVVNQTTDHHYSAIDDPVGCGLLGCLGGVIFSLFGGTLLLLLATLVAALMAPTPAIVQTPASQPDLRVTLDEGFLNRFVEQPTDGTLSIDILPSNQVAIIGNAVIPAFDVQAPIQITGIFELQFTGQTLQVSLVETEVSGFALPPELNNFFVDDIPIINQDLSTMMDSISQIFGVPMILTNVSTNHVQIQLELKEAQ